MVVRSAALVLVALVVTACGPGTPAVAPLEQASASPLESPVDSEPTPEPTAPAESPAPVVTPPAAAVAGPGFESVPATSVAIPDDLFPLGLSRDGSRLLVSGPDADGVGCEESEPYALQLFELSTGTVEAAVDPALGLNDVTRGPGDQVLLSAGCEGMVLDVMVGRETDEGRFVDLESVEAPAGRGEFWNITAVTLAPDGTLRWTLADTGAQLVTTDIAGEEIGSRVDLDAAIYDIAATSSTTYGIDYSGDDGGPVVVDLLTGEQLTGYDDLAAVPALDAVVLGGDSGVAVARADDALEVLVDDPAGDDVRWGAGPLLGEGLALAVADLAGQGRLQVVGPGGVVETVDVGVYLTPRPMLSLAGTRLVYSVLDPATDQVLFIMRDLD